MSYNAPLALNGRDKGPMLLNPKNLAKKIQEDSLVLNGNDGDPSD